MIDFYVKIDNLELVSGDEKSVAEIRFLRDPDKNNDDFITIASFKKEDEQSFQLYLTVDDLEKEDLHSYNKTTFSKMLGIMISIIELTHLEPTEALLFDKYLDDDETQSSFLYSCLEEDSEDDTEYEIYLEDEEGDENFGFNSTDD